MSLLKFALTPGEPIVDQVVFAATKAFVTGALPPGQPFPSVRALATDLKIHPNTALKAIQHLIEEGWLEVRPGIGTVVAVAPQAGTRDRQRLLQQDVERLVIDAKRLGLTLNDVAHALKSQWKSLDSPGESTSDDHRNRRSR